MSTSPWRFVIEIQLFTRLYLISYKIRNKNSFQFIKKKSIQSEVMKKNVFIVKFDHLKNIFKKSNFENWFQDQQIHNKKETFKKLLRNF